MKYLIYNYLCMLLGGVGAMLLSEYFNSFSSKLFSLSMCLLQICAIMGGMCYYKR